MPMHKDFRKILNNMIKQYGKEKGTQVFWAWVNKHGYDETKSLGSQQRKESFEWTMPIRKYKEQGDGIIIKGTAITVGETRNNNVYTEDELRLAARSLAKRPITVNHDEALDFPESQVLDAEFVDDHIEYTALIGAKKYIPIIAAGRIDHVSIEADYRYNMGDIVNGVVPKGVVFTGMSILMPDVEPGDPDSSVMVWEKLREARITDNSKEDIRMEDKKEDEVVEEATEETETADSTEKEEAQEAGTEDSEATAPVETAPVTETAEDTEVDEETDEEATAGEEITEDQKPIETTMVLATYSFPLDSKENVEAALEYWADAGNRQKHVAEEIEDFERRLIKAAKRFGVEVSDEAVVESMKKLIESEATFWSGLAKKEVKEKAKPQGLIDDSKPLTQEHARQQLEEELGKMSFGKMMRELQKIHPQLKK